MLYYRVDEQRKHFCAYILLPCTPDRMYAGVNVHTYLKAVLPWADVGIVHQVTDAVLVGVGNRL